MTDQLWSWNSFNLISMKSKAFFKTNSRQRPIEAYARTPNDEHQKSKNGKTRLFRKHWISRWTNKRTHCKFLLKHLCNERKMFLNCCFDTFRSMLIQAKTQKRNDSLMYQTLKRFWKCSRQNSASQQLFEQTTIWMRTKSNDWLMKNHKHLMFCSARKWKSRKSQAYRFELMLMRIASEQDMKMHPLDTLYKN